MLPFLDIMNRSEDSRFELGRSRAQGNDRQKDVTRYRLTKKRKAEITASLETRQETDDDGDQTCDPTDDSVLGSWLNDAAPPEVQQQPPVFADASSDEVFETNLQGDEFFENGADDHFFFERSNVSLLEQCEVSSYPQILLLQSERLFHGELQSRLVK